MRQQIIDRRLAGKNKSIGNRERFLRRHRDQIREAVKRAVDGRGIRDIEKGEDIRIPKRDIAEPTFGHGSGGKRERVHPGNKDYLRGDRIARPKGGAGGTGRGQASDSGEGEDDFVFHLTKEEFMQVFFDDLALPNLERTQLADVPEYKTHRAAAAMFMIMCVKPGPSVPEHAVTSPVTREKPSAAAHIAPSVRPP